NLQGVLPYILRFISCGLLQLTKSALDRPTQIHRPHEPAVAIRVDGASLGNQRSLCKVVAWPAREDKNLERARLFSKQSAEPVHPVVVALDELVVQHDG